MKNKFVKSTLILMLGGAITKILGMIIKIVTNRLIGVEGLGVYMLITPTFMLLIAIAQLGFPIAISKLVAEEKNNNKKIRFNTELWSNEYFMYRQNRNTNRGQNCT